MGRGLQRIADSETRLRADDENAAQRASLSGRSAVMAGRRNDAELIMTNSQPPTPKPRKRKRDAADEVLDPSERPKQKKKKKDKGKKHRKEKSPNKAAAASTSSTGHRPNESGSHITSEELTSALDGLIPDSPEPDPDLQITHTKFVARPARTTLRPNPVLQAKGKTEDLPIDVEELDSSDEVADDMNEEVADEQPAGPSRDAGRKSLPLRNHRRPLQPINNGANLARPPVVVANSPDQGSETEEWYTPAGEPLIRKIPVLFKSRHWQAPYQYEFNGWRKGKKRSNGRMKNQGRQKGKR